MPVWPRHARYGERAGQENQGFLDLALFRGRFLRPLEPYLDRLAVLIFEFGTFAKSVFPTTDDFLARLDHFLAGLPEGFRFAVEIRNPEYLGPGYFRLPRRSWRGPRFQRLDADAGAFGTIQSSRCGDGGFYRRAHLAEQGPLV